MLTLGTVAKFTWSFGCMFHLETDVGDFEWSDPDYGGDNTIRPSVPYSKWLEERGIEFGRCKGTHTIGDYCGPNVHILGA